MTNIINLLEYRLELDPDQPFITDANWNEPGPILSELLATPQPDSIILYRKKTKRTRDLDDDLDQDLPNLRKKPRNTDPILELCIQSLHKLGGSQWCYNPADQNNPGCIQATLHNLRTALQMNTTLIWYQLFRLGELL